MKRAVLYIFVIGFINNSLANITKSQHPYISFLDAQYVSILNPSHVILKSKSNFKNTKTNLCASLVTKENKNSKTIIVSAQANVVEEIFGYKPIRQRCNLRSKNGIKTYYTFFCKPKITHFKIPP